MHDTGLEPDRLIADLLSLQLTVTLLWLFLRVPAQGWLLEARQALAAEPWNWLPVCLIILMLYLQAWIVFHALVRWVFSRMFCTYLIRSLPDSREAVNTLGARIFSLPVSKALKADLFMTLVDEKPNTFGEPGMKENIHEGEKADD